MMLAQLSSQCHHVMARAQRHSRRLQRRAGRLAAAGSRLAGGGGGAAAAAAALAAGGGGAAVTVLAAGAAAPLPGPSGSRPPERRSGGGPLDFGSPLRRCTDALLLLNVLLFAGQWATHDVLVLWGAKVNSLIAAGQWWRLLTSSFLHTSVFHLAINSYSLAAIGPHVELLSGRGRFMAVYLASALAGTTASFLLTPAPSVGASAALFGLGASLGVFYWRHRRDLGHQSSAVLQQLGVTLVVNLGYSLANRRIDNWGHMGGLLGGALVAWLLGPRLVRDIKTGRVVDQPPLPLLARRRPADTRGGKQK